MFVLLKAIFLLIVFLILVSLIYCICVDITKKIRDKKNREYINYINENSLPVKNLILLNEKYNFVKLVSFDESKTYDNEKFYDLISCEDYLIYQLQYKKYDILKQIKIDYSNKENYKEYLNNVKNIEGFDVFVHAEKYKKEKLKLMERELFDATVIGCPEEFRITIKLMRSNIYNNCIYERKEETFDCDKIKELIDRVNDKNREFYNDSEIWNAICRVERGRVSNKLRFRIYERDGYRCRYCGASENQVDLEIDHIKPIAKGGKSVESNLQTLCKRCNKEKGADY